MKAYQSINKSAVDVEIAGQRITARGAIAWAAIILAAAVAFFLIYMKYGHHVTGAVRRVREKRKARKAARRKR